MGDTWPHLGPPSSPTACLPLVQRFRFCGDLDCPDWVLAEISTLAKIVECTGSSRGWSGQRDCGWGLRDGREGGEVTLRSGPQHSELILACCVTDRVADPL